MKKYMNQKNLILFLLCATILCASFPVMASSTTSTSHRQTIQQFIDDINLLQNQVFTLAQLSFESAPEDKSDFQNKIMLINSRIESVNKKILAYLATLPSISSENSDTLLVQNALNLVKNSLYQLNLLIDATTNLEKLLILQEFFRLRVNATETLTGIQNIIS